MKMRIHLHGDPIQIDLSPFHKENQSRMEKMKSIEFSHPFHDRPTHTHCRDVMKAASLTASYGSNWTANGHIRLPIHSRIPANEETSIHRSINGKDMTILHPMSVGPGRKYKSMLEDAGFTQLLGPCPQYRNAIVLAAMAHDWGKVETFDPSGGEKGKAFFRGHEKVSAQILAEMGAPELVCNLVREHGNIRDVSRMSSKGIGKIIKRLTPEGECELVVLHLFDHLLLADSSAFSEEGKTISRKQWSDWRAKAYASIK